MDGASSTPIETGHELYDHYVSGHQGDVETAGNIASLEATILPRLPQSKEARILDCGCGQGVLLGVLKQHGFHNTAGIDISPEQVELALQRGHLNVIVENLFDHARLHAGEYDVVVALDVAEHFSRSEVISLFRAWFSMLRPQGRLIIRTPNGSSPFAGRYLYSDLTHGVIFTDTSIRQAAHAVGFDRVTVYPARPAGVGTRRRIRAAMWRLCELVIKTPLVIETGQLRGHIVTQNLIAECRRPRLLTRGHEESH